MNSLATVLVIAAVLAPIPAATLVSGPAPPAVLLEEVAQPQAHARPPATYVVKSGDNLWKIAAALVQARSGRIPSSAEIGGYWWRLIEENRQRIISGDPNLIYPGEELVLPPFSPALPFNPPES